MSPILTSLGLRKGAAFAPPAPPPAVVEDFSGYTPGLPPPGWTRAWSTDVGSWTVVAEEGRNILRASTLPAEGNFRRGIVWDGHDAADVEVLARVRLTAYNASGVNTIGGGIFVRGSQLDAGATMYVLNLRSAGNAPTIAQLGRYENGSLTELASVPFAWSRGAWYWMRLRAFGTRIQGKVWLDGSQEPTEWTFDVIDANLTAGWVGALDFLGQANASEETHTDIDWFGVSTSSAAVPLPTNLTPQVALTAFTGSSYVTGTSVTQPVPPEVQEGDLLVAVLLHRSTVTPPSGWTRLLSEGVDRGSYVQTLEVWTKTAGASESDVTFTQSNSDRMGLALVALRSPNGVTVAGSAAATSAENHPVQEVALPGTTSLALLASSCAYALTGGNPTSYVPPAPYLLAAQSVVLDHRLALGYRNALPGEDLPAGGFFAHAATSHEGVEAIVVFKPQ